MDGGVGGGADDGAEDVRTTCLEEPRIGDFTKNQIQPPLGDEPAAPASRSRTVRTTIHNP